MKKTFLLSCAAALLLISCNNNGNQNEAVKNDTATTATNDTKSEEAWVPVDSATMMQKWMEYATPGDMHKMLASWEGAWEGDMTSWDYEGAAPRQSKVHADYNMILGGKYLSSVHKGDMMGMSFEGHDLLGYDNATKKFVDIWVDNFGTGVMHLTGDYDASAKTLTLAGMSPDICHPGKECETKQVITIVDATHHKMEMYGPDPKTGKMFKMMEISSTKKM
jgi:hypothetical protein